MNPGIRTLGFVPDDLHVFFQSKDGRAGAGSIPDEPVSFRLSASLI
ncbi:hypothetical protein [Rhodopila globiformis]|nr:hypothetical protein [Rhodopila globiformis]